MTYRKFMVGLFAFACFSLCMSVFAEDRFSPGEKLSHSLSVCLDKQDAIEILNAENKGGYEAASKVWESKDGCGTVVVQGGPTVGKVVYAISIERGGKKLVGKVVEILVNGKVEGYFLTSRDVGLKKERDS